jgi:branched-chain amino acid transport system ATP-binding protein
MERPALQVDNIHSYYGDSYVLQGVSLSVGPGQIACVLGRNGVGKTTLIRSIIAFTPPRQGRVLFGDVELTRLPAHRIMKLGLGLVPQGRRIFPSLTVAENLSIALRRPQDAGLPVWHIDDVLQLFPALRERLRNGAGTLSGGEQQMLAIARALVSNPRLLLMDEPTEGLSPHVVAEIKALVLRLRASGMPILLVEQDLEFALAVADETYVMDKGRIVYRGRPEQIERDDAIRETYLGLGAI